MDKYDEVSIEILETIKNDGRNDEEIQKKVINILKNNFNVTNEEMGKGLAKDVWMFDPESGHEFDAPLFTAPMFLPLGVKVVQHDTFPNYSIENKYIGYTEKGIFYKINDFTRLMRRARKNPLPVILLFILAYILIAILAIAK